MSDAATAAASADAQALVHELRAAARAFTDSEQAAAQVVQTMADDVERAMGQPLAIFPVMHHSPASAAQMVRYLRTTEPKVVFIELCEDLQPIVSDLADCTLPVALQAFASQPDGFPESWAPLSLVAPLTELSAEYQAIAYAQTTPGVELVFVDRSVDHVYQWRDRSEDPDAPVHDDFDDEDDETLRLHGGSLAVEVGSVEPTFADFRDFLLRNARMSHFSEWVSLYIEQPTLQCDTVAYREIMCMVGSLFRRLGTTPHAREEIRRRDRYMWTRIKQKLADDKIDPSDAVFICGAAHIVDDDTPEWGLDNDRIWQDLEPRSPTSWQYGLVPSSYGAIEMQFGHPRGAVSLAEAEWKKAVRRSKLTPYALPKPKRKSNKRAAKKTSSKKAASKKTAKPKAMAAPEQLSLQSVLRDAPSLSAADETELINWCSNIVARARKNRYLASTADAIAIYETSILLARMRARNRPSPYDFVDAAETCLEKTTVPGRHSIRQLCHRMLGGDRVGQVGYESLPPLVQDIYDRLEPVNITPDTKRVVRVLLDFAADPDARQVSQLLWRLHWMLPGTRVARPIMGELALGVTPQQESWDVRLSGPEQRAVIELAFQGVSVEQVLEASLHTRAFADDATTLDALEAAEACALLLEQSRLFDTLGMRAVQLLRSESGAEKAPDIFRRVRRLVHHFRGTPEGLPEWLESFVATGYSHYASQLPVAFDDRGTGPDQVAAMLSFILTLESLALTVGCSRSELLIALEQAATAAHDPEKLGLLWAAEWAVQIKDEHEITDAFEAILAHPLGRNAYPRYLSGFIRAMAFAPRAAPVSLSLLGRAFAVLPDGVLLPWLPGLLSTLKPLAGAALPALFKELTIQLPRSYSEAAEWRPPWHERQSHSTSAEQVLAVASVDPALAGFVADRADSAAAWVDALGVEPGLAASPEQEPAVHDSGHLESAIADWVGDHAEASDSWAHALGLA